jgi:septal ring factor EnvC (AmiA/AmiB activator)
MFSFNKVMLTVLVGLSFSLAYAKDISDEQYQVRVAQKEYDNASADYQAQKQQIEQLEMRVTQLNAQLDPLKKSLPAKESRLNKAKANLDEKTKILDKVWEENKKR